LKGVSLQDDIHKMKIYKIVTPYSPKCYVGKTTTSLARRLQKHKGNFTCWERLTGNWCSSFGLIWLGDCSIELLEETDDHNAESKWINQVDCVNKNRLKHGIGANYDVLAAKRDFYRENTEMMRARTAVRKAADPEHYRKLARESYHRQPKKKVAEKRKLAYNRNRVKILEKTKVKIVCQYCGYEGRKAHLKRHQTTQKCKEHQLLNLKPLLKSTDSTAE